MAFFYQRCALVLACVIAGICLANTLQCDLSNNCLCYQPTPSTYEFHCPPESHKIIIRTNLNDVEVECADDVDWANQTWPILNLQHVKSVKITCSAQNQSVDKILSSLGVNSTESLKLAENWLALSQMTTRLSSVKVIDVSKNKIERLEGTEFLQLPNLVQIDLSGNLIKDLPKTLLMTLPNLRTLTLSNNNITALHEGTFSLNRRLEYLDLSANPINLETIPLKELSSIRNLRLANAHIVYLPDNFLAALTQLEDLDLSDNEISAIPDYTFRSLIKLKSLNLKGNSLTRVTKGMLRSNHNLERVNLGDNGITHINIHAFQRNIKLNDVILANNKYRLTESEVALGVSPFQANVNLERLDLSRNRISDVSDDWLISKIHLKRLDLSHNEINSLALTDLIGVSSNLSIDLSHNRISTVDFRMAKHLTLMTNQLFHRTVTLNENPLKCDCHMYDFSKYFDGTINPLIPVTIKIIADSLRCAEPEEHLNKPVAQVQSHSLSCTVKSCPEMCKCGFRAWDRALIVDCSYKNLTVAPRLHFEANGSYNYSVVNLQGNLLTTGPAGGFGYENVQKLNLAFNNISAISWMPPKLQVLDLTHNNIEHLDEDILHKFNASPTLTTLSLGGNPWKCGCLALRFRSFMISQLVSKRMIDADNIRCKDDGKLLIHLSISDVCLTLPGVVVACSLFLALLASAIAIMTCICAFSRRKKLYTVF